MQLVPACIHVAIYMVVNIVNILRANKTFMNERVYDINLVEWEAGRLVS